MSRTQREEWAVAAAALGLEPCLGPRTFPRGDLAPVSYATLAAKLSPCGPPADDRVEPLDAAYWARGHRGGTEVAAGIPFAETEPRATTGPRAVTVVVACIVAPLDLSPPIRGGGAGGPAGISRELSVWAASRKYEAFARLSPAWRDAYDGASARSASLVAGDTSVVMVLDGIVVEGLERALEDAAILATGLYRARTAFAIRDAPSLYVNGVPLAIHLAWDAFAQAQGLSFEGALEGAFLGWKVHVATLDAAGDPAAKAARIEVRLPRALHSVTFGREASRWWLARRFLHDLQVGDPAFDDRVFIDGAPTDPLTRELLTPAVRDALMRALDWAESVEIDGSTLAARADGPLATVHALSRALTDVTVLAEALTAPQARPDPDAPYR